MPKKQGTLEVNGEVAYCGQSVQLLARATLRENILFGLPLDVEMYERALMCTHCQEWVADVLPSGIHSFSFVSRRTAMLHAHVRSLEVLPMMPRVHVCMHVFTHIHLHEPIRQCFAHANACARMASGSAVLSFLFMCTHAHTNPYTHTHTCGCRGPDGARRGRAPLNSARRTGCHGDSVAGTTGAGCAGPRCLQGCCSLLARRCVYVRCVYVCVCHGAGQLCGRMDRSLMKLYRVLSDESTLSSESTR